MRIALIVALAMVLAPLALSARPASGLTAPVTELSAAKKKPKPKKAKDEYLKAAPGAGPSGPKY